MIIEPIEYASQFIKNVAADYAPNAKAVAMFQVYDASSAEKYPVLRDRTEELSKAVMGMAEETVWQSIVLTGKELFHNHGAEIVGAQFVQKFKFIFA